MTATPQDPERRDVAIDPVVDPVDVGRHSDHQLGDGVADLAVQCAAADSRQTRPLSVERSRARIQETRQIVCRHLDRKGIAGGCGPQKPDGGWRRDRVCGLQVKAPGISASDATAQA